MKTVNGTAMPGFIDCLGLTGFVPLPGMMNGFHEPSLNGCVPRIEELTLFTTESAFAPRLRAMVISNNPMVNAVVDIFH